MTGAVDDLIHGYESLVHSIPSIASKVKDAHKNTEEMAKELEVKNQFY